MQQTSDLLFTQIIRKPTAPSIFHSKFDNFDQLLNDLTGKGSIHTAYGIMLQEIDGKIEECSGTLPEVTPVAKTGQCSLQLDRDESLPECYVISSQRKIPCFNIARQTCLGGAETIMAANK